MTIEYASLTQAVATSAIPLLIGELFLKAEWRERKALDYPDDGRNLEASRSLRALADELLAVHKSERPSPLGQRYSALYFSKYIGACDFEVGEAVDKYISAIGFHHFPSDVDALLSDVCSILAEPAPVLRIVA